MREAAAPAKGRAPGAKKLPGTAPKRSTKLGRANRAPGASISSPEGAEPLLTKPELARRFLLRSRQIDNHLANGMPAVREGESVRFRWSECFPWYVQMRIDAVRGRTPGDEGAKARLEEATAKLAELKLAREERRVVEVAEVVKAWADTAQRIAGKLNVVPSKYAARCVGLETVGQAVKVLDAAVQEVLGELAEAPPHE